MTTEPKDVATGLLQAVRAKFPNGVSFEEIKSRQWSSDSFRGAIHEIALRLDGDGAEQAATAFSMNLAASDFDFPGHLVADIKIVAQGRWPGLARIRLTALTVEEK